MFDSSRYNNINHLVGVAIGVLNCNFGPQKTVVGHIAYINPWAAPHVTDTLEAFGPYVRIVEHGPLGTKQSFAGDIR